MKDYIPDPDGDFLAWSQNFVAYAMAHAADLDIAPTEPPNTLLTNFQTAMTALAAAQAGAQATRQTKDAARTSLEQAIRALVRRLQASASVDDGERAALGITVRDTVHTTSASGPASRPIGAVDTGQRLRHEIRFSDEATPTKKARPAGVMGCEIWVKVSPMGTSPPSDPSELTFLGLDTATPYMAEYEGADAGKTAHYMLRWVKTNGEKGTWSETVSATIAG